MKNINYIHFELNAQLNNMNYINNMLKYQNVYALGNKL